MTTKYIVYNPITGQNTYVNTESEARELFLQNLIDFAEPYFHNTPYTLADIDDAGTETTRAPEGIDIRSVLNNN